jgi:hypothetical protein
MESEPAVKMEIETPVDSVNASPFAVGQAQKDAKLVDIRVTDDNVALNLMVSFLNLAQKRGAFGLDESAKIWECISRFIQTR